MKNDNWEKVETIFHQALSFQGIDREKYLEKNCFNDSFLLSEVKSLIASFENEIEFLENPVLDIGLTVLHQKTEKTRTNTILGFYQIGEKLGSGGMGEVYEAIDTRLDRKVALKFLSDSLKNDTAAKRQLRKEARAIAMLEHPNICAVYGIEEIKDDSFIVMQFLDGVTLEKSIKNISITLQLFKALAKQIIEAVAFAHSHGVIHRDLKPGNIMLSDRGRIKVLDFGLAKIIGQQKLFERSNAAYSSQLSQNGIIVGTISYMSPEQLRGEKLDYQTDIFSLGIILYELLAKENPFQRQTQVETIAAILSDSSVRAENTNPKLPAGIVNIINRCLEKDKNKRFQSTAEILLELDAADIENFVESKTKKRKKISIKTTLAAIFLITIFIAGLFFLNITRPQKTLAILPISIEQGLNEKEYLADGLTKSIIDKLSNLSNLKVKNESVITPYKGKTNEPLNIGKELMVDAVLVGTIKSRADGLFLETKLIRVADGILIDSSNESKIKETNLNDLPRDISLRIIDKIQSKLTTEDKDKIDKKETESERAKDLYMQGRFYLKQRKDADGLRKAINFFTDAKDLDQNYAKAWAGLADAYLSQSTAGVRDAIAPEKAVQLAKPAAKKAVELDNTLSEAYNSLGAISLKYEWNWIEAENYYRTAISIDAQFLPPRFGLINILGFQGRYDEAEEEIRKIKEIEPLSIAADVERAVIYYKKYEYEQMEKILSELSQRFPDNRRIKYVRSYQFLKMKRFGEAIGILETFYKSGNQEDKIYAGAPLGFAFAKIKRRDDALKIIKDLEEIKRDNYVPSQEKAIIYTGLGEYDKVFENLKMSCQEKYPSLPGLVTDPLVDEIWSDARFAEIKKCANL